MYTFNAISKVKPTLLISILIWGFSSLSLAAQETPQSIFGEIIEVRLVNLEAVVENRRGGRVHGLKAEDFELRVDGEEVPIQFFSEVKEGRAVESTSTSDATQPRMTPGDRVETSYLVFIDDYFTRAKRRNRVLDGIHDHLSRLAP